MTDAPVALEGKLHDDVVALGEEFADDESATELYRALANTVWRTRNGPEGHVSLSWSRAEAIVNDLRRRHGREPLDLAQTGGEGEVSDRVAEAVGPAGWVAQPLNTSRHDDAHATEPESPPPPDHGARMAPVEDPGGWERVAHAEADREQLRRPGDQT
jgi:hypothetical protein